MTDKQQIDKTTPQPNNIRQGWQCPKCGSIISPDKDYCPFCSNDLNYTITCEIYDRVPANTTRGIRQ